MRGVMGTRYEFLSRGAVPVDDSPGHSNYFAPLSEEHDPRLFEPGTDRLREDVRQDLLRALFDFWSRHYSHPEDWGHAWIAGSALSKQWSEGPDGKGDLDVLVGVDLEAFSRWHRVRVSEADIAREMNELFRAELWPAMADYRGQFEVTFYLNPRTGSDIRKINPYAAYNLRTGQWDVTPIELPDTWSEDVVPQPVRHAIDEEIKRAREIVERYGQLVRELAVAPEGPRRVNLMRSLGHTVAQATALFETIHSERRHAFQGRFGVPGEGYLDYHNFRWQMHKQAGTRDALSAIRRVGREAEVRFSTENYGAHIV